MLFSVCFGTGREHKLNLRCGLFGVSDRKWPWGAKDGAGGEHEEEGSDLLRRGVLARRHLAHCDQENDESVDGTDERRDAALDSSSRSVPHGP